jgi:hypothetical protein
MTRTPALVGPARNKLNSLLAALRAPGDNTVMVRQRTLGLLSYKPADLDRKVWLGSVLHEDWQVNDCMTALTGQASTNAKSDGNGQPAEQSNDAGGVPVRQRQHGRRRRSRR